MLMAEADIGEIRRLAKTFLVEAFEQLKKLHVLPRSRYSPDILVGSDYEGGVLESCPSFPLLEQAIQATFRSRFDCDAAIDDLEFPHLYIYDFVESAVRRCTLNRDPYDDQARGALDSFEELITVLESRTVTAVACRVVQHMTTHDDSPMFVGEVAVHPATGWDALREIDRIIPGTSLALPRELPLSFMSPSSVVYATTETEGNPSIAAESSSRQIAKFLQAVRLYGCSTTSTEIEVRGQTTRIGRLPPHSHEFLFRGEMNVVLQRPAVLEASHSGLLATISKLLSDASSLDEGKLIASWNIALARFDKSHQNPVWHENLVDLVTALEATLIGDGEENTALMQRLRQRSAALLGCNEDPPTAIYDDIGVLYGLRSTLVHGGNLNLKSLRKKLKKISTTAGDAPDGILTEMGVDRLKDITRRAILARLCLSIGPDAPWPRSSRVQVDRHLSDDGERTKWRAAWHQHLKDLGLSAACRPAPRLTKLGRQEVA